ncbi:hypothetical protein AGMMS49525_16410 [Bacteroidia bacterium]|nr:hypothetical protein AGMMS49525_16410 [Bacteroidia bacterium]
MLVICDLQSIRYDSKTENQKHCRHQLASVFRDTFQFRKELDLMYNAENILSKELVEDFVQKVDLVKQNLNAILLKIIGERPPVSEKELIEKYDFKVTLEMLLADL